jgi:hypothetical protein
MCRKYRSGWGDAFPHAHAERARSSRTLENAGERDNLGSTSMSAAKPLTGRGPFSHEPPFADFLSNLGSDLREPNALPARNFLLDEGVQAARVESYRAIGGVALHGSLTAWESAHTTYLVQHVRGTNTGTVPALINPANLDECPETFADIDPTSCFLTTDPKVHLLRTVEIASIARTTREPPRLIQSLAEELANKPRVEPARARMDDILHEFAKNCDLRPVFAAFWQDLSTVFGTAPTNDPPGWADTLRDQCGLSHLDPGTRGIPIPVLIFRYPVEDVPRLRGALGTQPLVPPTVLDSHPFPPFCPAPLGNITGSTIDLGGNSGALRREVLHPCTVFRAAHVFRVGHIQRPVALDLLPIARGLHLLEVQELSKRADYAEDTDGDLFR